MRPRFLPLRSLVIGSVVLASAFGARRAAAADDPDPWFGRDKALHFGVSTVLAGGTYAVAATQFDARGPALLLAGATTLTIGAAKEGADALGLGDPSWKDFTWDVVGTVAGLAIAWVIDVAVRGVGPAHPAFVSPH